MALMYMDTEEKEKAKVAAQIVLTKEPKVQSTAVRETQEEARKIMIMISVKGDSSTKILSFLLSFKEKAENIIAIGIEQEAE